MITFLDAIGPAVWRASWQAAALAIVVMLLGAPSRGTHLAALALSALERCRHPDADRGCSRKPLERVQSRSFSAGGKRATDRRAPAWPDHCRRPAS